MSEKGFTATFISNTGKTLYQFNITGWKLYLTRILLALFVLIVSAAAIIVAYGFLNAGDITDLREEISLLQDSLTARRNIESRLENLETDIQQLHEFRQKLENIASMIPVSEDSLGQ